MRKRTKRKVWALVDPVAHAIAGAAVTDTKRLDQLRTTELSALHSFATGCATPDDWRALADMVNVAETMAREGIGPEVFPVCAKAEEALATSHARHSAGRTLGFDGAGLQAMRDLAEYHDLQRSSVSRSVYELCIKKTADRIRSAPADVKVLI